MLIPNYDKYGRLIHNGERYTAIKELAVKLAELDIDYEMHEMLDGYQICVPSSHRPNNFEGDAIQHFGSYGADLDLIEVYGFGLNEPDGYLTVEAALDYFIKWRDEKEDEKHDTK